MSALTILQAKVTNPMITTLMMEGAIAEVQQVVRNYCNFNDTDVIPAALDYTVANMARDLVLYDYQAGLTVAPSTDSVDAADVTGITVGDTSISIGAGSGQRARTLAGHSANLDSLVLSYTAQLNKFRRLVW